MNILMYGKKGYLSQKNQYSNFWTSARMQIFLNVMTKFISNFTALQWAPQSRFFFGWTYHAKNRKVNSHKSPKSAPHLEELDDIITVLPRNSTEEFLNFINSINTDIKFTVETENNNKLPYVDLEIVKQNNG